MMPRVFVHRALTAGDTVRIADETGHHYARVLRVRIGEPVAVAADSGAWLAEIAAVDAKQGWVEVRVASRLPSHESTVAVHLIQALAKGDKIEGIIQRTTEIGVAGIWTLATARSVMQLADAKVRDRVERWQRVACEAAGQAQRDIVPTVQHVRSLADLGQGLANAGVQAVWLLDEAPTAAGLRTALRAWSEAHGGPPTRVAVAVGPEGGWDEAERSQWYDVIGALSTSLGPRVLRTETAGAAAISAILYEFGELGG